MTPSEAIQLLDKAQIDESAPSRINVCFTCGEVRDIVRDGLAEIEEKRPHKPLDRIMEKRVHQCLRNQPCPRF